MKRSMRSGIAGLSTLAVTLPVLADEYDVEWSASGEVIVRDFQEPVDALPGVHLQQQRRSLRGRRQTERGRQGRLADASLAGDDEKFVIRQRRRHSLLPRH